MWREGEGKRAPAPITRFGAVSRARDEIKRPLGVTTSLFIDHLYYWGDVLVDGLFGLEHGSTWVRAGSALAAGLRISFHNDGQVTPPEPLRNGVIQLTRWSIARADRDNGRRNLWLRTLDRMGLGFDS